MRRVKVEKKSQTSYQKACLEALLRKENFDFFYQNVRNETLGKVKNFEAPISNGSGTAPEKPQGGGPIKPPRH